MVVRHDFRGPNRRRTWPFRAGGAAEPALQMVLERGRAKRSASVPAGPGGSARAVRRSHPGCAAPAQGGGVDASPTEPGRRSRTGPPVVEVEGDEAGVGGATPGALVEERVEASNDNSFQKNARSPAGWGRPPGSGGRRPACGRAPRSPRALGHLVGGSSIEIAWSGTRSARAAPDWRRSSRPG